MNLHEQVRRLELRQKLYTDDPDTLPEAVKIDALYQWNIWGKFGRDPMQLPDEGEFKGLVEGVESNRLMLNVEQWAPHNTSNFIETDDEKDAIGRLVKMIEWVRDVRPDLNVGYYRTPLRDYWGAIGSVPDQYDAWLAANDRLKPVIDASDSLYVSVYTLYEDSEKNRDRWKQYATANVNEAIRVASGQEIVVAFWQRYHPGSVSSDIGRQPIPADWFREQVEHVEAMQVDGLLFWDSQDWYVNKYGADRVDDNHPTRQALRDWRNGI